jgi:hypothetical protein
MENEEPKQEGTPSPVSSPARGEERVNDPHKEEIAALKQDLSRTLGAYRDSLIKLNPELPAEMVGGDTVEAVDESIAKARALVSKVKQSIEAEKTASRVPAGAPARGEADYSGLSTREKIQIGIGGK